MKALQILNIVAFAIALFANYYLNAHPPLGESIGDISDQYQNLFTPASYAFSIWGLIYLMLGAFVVYQARGLFLSEEAARRSNVIVKQVGPWFIVSMLTNAAWVYVWLNKWVGLSVVVMVVVFISLLIITIRGKLEVWDAPLSVLALFWWPFCLYFGWITVALIANIAAWLTASDLVLEPFIEVATTCAVISIAGAIYIYMTWSRNMREYAAVGIWGLVAVAVANWQTTPIVAYVAVGVSVVIFVSSGIHASKHINTLPFIGKPGSTQE